jgi:hypothetical protein
MPAAPSAQYKLKRMQIENERVERRSAGRCSGRWRTDRAELGVPSGWDKTGEARQIVSALVQRGMAHQIKQPAIPLDPIDEAGSHSDSAQS